MASDAPPGTRADLDWLLGDFLGRSPYVQGAVLLSADGLKTAAAGLDQDSADYLAALSATLYSTSRAAGRFGGEVRQVVIELDRVLLFIASAGSGSRLTVLAAREADLGVLGYEIAQLVKSVEPALATPARQPAAGGPHGPAGRK